MKKLLMNKRKYTLTDYIKIPFLISPFYMSIIILSKIVSALIPSIQVLVTASFINTALDIFSNKVQRNDIYLSLGLLMIILAYQSLSGVMMSLIYLKFDMKMTRIYRSAVVEKRAKLSYCHVENNDTWDLISRTCENPEEKVSNGFYNIFDIVQIIIQVTSLLIILMAQVWWAGVVIVSICIPLFFLATKAGKAIYDANKEAAKHNRRAGYLQEVLQGRENIEERTLFGYTKGVNDKWYEKFEIARKINLKVSLEYFIRMKSSSLITVVISVLIVAILLYPLSKGEITIGMFMALVSATFNMVNMMSWQLSMMTRDLANGKEYLKDLTAFYALSETEGAIDLPINSKEVSFESIEFNNVSFRYPNTEKYILKDFTLILNKNVHYAIVGINGAGKTTITKLLTGMYDNFEGEILINGISIKKCNQSYLKGLFSVVYQDFAKYYIPMKDNISLGNMLKYDEGKIKEDTDATIIDVASVMGLDNAITNLPDGIDTWLGKIKENGVDLSGGEWQRVAIARALYNPAIVRILDEPTATLDPVAESNIYEMFGRINAGKSTIYITHRLGGARLADEIVVIDDGTVKEKGNHETLLDLCGIYAEMYEAQRSWYI